MVLNFGNFFGKSIFNATAEDGQIGVWYGERFIPGGLDSTNQSETVNASTAASDSAIGTQAWNNPDNAKVIDSSYADAQVSASYDIDSYDNVVQLVKAGAVTGNNKAISGTRIPATTTDRTYGSSTDKWGIALTKADVEASNFGIVYSATNNQVTEYLKLTDFGVDLPQSATVEGVEATIRMIQLAGTPTKVRIYGIQLKIYYLVQEIS